jgi:hypothetical protein
MAENVQDIRGEAQCTPSPDGCCSKRSAIISAILGDFSQLPFDSFFWWKQNRGPKWEKEQQAGGPASRLILPGLQLSSLSILPNVCILTLANRVALCFVRLEMARQQL